MKKYFPYIAGILIVAIFFFFNFGKVFADQVDQSNATGGTSIGFGQAAGLKYSCQGFKPTLNNVTAIAWKMNNAVSAKGRLVWIDNADANSFPTGTLAVGIGSVEISAATVTAGNGTTAKYSFASPITVTIGNQYVVCMAPWDTTTHVYADDYSDYDSSVVNPYANGKMAAYDCSGACTWTNNDSGNGDRVFQVFGNGAVSQSSSIVNKSASEVNIGARIVQP